MYRLCQIHLMRWRADIDDDDRLAFSAELNRIEALSEIADGFYWRWMDSDRTATTQHVFGDSHMRVNLSAWASVAGLRAFMQSPAYVDVERRRHRWFLPVPSATPVLWWTQHGHWPSPAEAHERWTQLRNHGASEEAFTLRQPFAAPGTSMIPPRR